MPIDSDDELLPDALEQFAAMWATIPGPAQSQCCGVVGLCIDSVGNVIGDIFPADTMDTDSVSLWFDFGVSEEKFSCLRTEVLREFPFPEHNPKLVPENVVWFRMAKQYRIRCFNIPVRIYHQDVVSLCRRQDPLRARRERAAGSVLAYSEALGHVNWHRSGLRCT